MTNNYIRVGPPLDCHFVFFNTSDPASVEAAKNKLSALSRVASKGPQGIWVPHNQFPEVFPIGR